MRKVLVCLLTLALVFGCVSVQAEGVLTPGTYTSTMTAMHGPMTVEVTVTDSAITSVEVVNQVETPGVTDPVFEKIPAAIVENQTTAVDTITGATVSSRVLMAAVQDCLKQAGDTEGIFSKELEKPPAEDVTMTADVIIVGGGGAGLAAAVSASDEGASVIVIEKTGFLGGNSIVAGGIYNAPDPDLQDYAEISGDQDSLVEAALAEEPVSEEHAELQEAVRLEFEAYKETDKTLFDSANWFALQTWNGGDKIADLDLVKVLTAGAYPALEWLESMGMEFNDFVTLGGGSLYPRTHGATTPNGTGYIKAFTNTLDGRDNVQIIMDTTGKSLITDGDKVVGVNAVGRDGNAVTLMANKGVILATGGFAGNVELRQKYCEGEKWPDLGPSLTTSNMPGVTGDGIFMAEAVGAELVDMDQIQLLPFCNPQTGATFDITSANCFINKNGERFVREDGRRDEMAKAMIAQPDGLVYYIFSCEDPNEVYSLGKQTLQYYLDNNLYGYMIDTSLEGLAEQMGVPADTLAETVEAFNAHTKAGDVDEFGRTSWAETIEGPYYVAYQRKPAVHHTMGGVRIDTETHALRADGSIIEGLYCAGEIVGGIHGGNRLGGNAIVDFCVFGRLAGTHAATDD